jgi:hypothetical protein
MHKKDVVFFLTYISYSIILSLYTLIFWIIKGKHTGDFFGYSFGWVGWICLVIAIILLSLFLLIFIVKSSGIPEKKPAILGNKKIAIFLLLTLFCLSSIYISIFIQQEKIGNSISRFWLISETTLFCVVIMKYMFGLHFLPSFAISILFIGTIYAAYDQLSTVSNYPFSLAWSEGSRFYYASLFLSQKLYGRILPWEVLDRARSIIQAIPYAFNLRSIFIQRLWQMILWLSLPGITSYTLVRRYYPKNNIKMLLATTFIFLALLFAPVYFYLTLCVIPLIIFGDPKKPRRTLFLVILCSIWAGLCRINWYFIPAGLGVLFYLFETPVQNKNYLKYFFWPAIWFTFGTIFAFLASSLYTYFSGNPPYLFGTALHSPLLWYRLFPNSTYDLGILLSAILVFLPIYLIVDLKIFRERLGFVRSSLVLFILMVFFCGGLIVSVKIGGGSNLHNFDAFIVLSLVFCAFGFFGFQSIRDESIETNKLSTLPGMGFIASCMIIVGSIAIAVNSPKSFQQNEIQKEIVDLQTLSSKYEGNLLLLSERQLIATGELNPRMFEPNFEVVTLMEMVMSNNVAYLNQFYYDLKQHTFSMIITKPINSKLQDRNAKFSRENNLWVKKVEIPILESYKLVAELPLSQIEIYIPK